jgi:hypothetical protein
LFGAGLERELTDATTASDVLQTALDAETKEHVALQSATRAVCDALETQEGVQLGKLWSHLTALYGGVRERVRDALHTGMKRALAVMTSHYDGLDLQHVSEGFVDMPDLDLEKLVDAAEALGAVLATRFEGEVVPLLLTCEEAWAIAPM